MFTDSPPRRAELASFNESDRITTLAVPPQAEVLTQTQSIETGMKIGKARDVHIGCAQFLKSLSRFYQVPPCGIRVLASRPLRIRENWSSELFGDYDPSTMAIRVWMRTAVKKDITSFGTFLSTLATNTATISICSISTFLIPGIHAASTSVPLRFTTMPAAHLESGYSGLPHRAGAGG